MSALVYTGMLYTPLSKSDIRVLTVETHDEGSISCYLHTVTLSVELKFTALSYVWGDQSVKEVIKINGHPFPIGANLWKALKDISQIDWFTKDSYLWIDAVCINQDDNGEKSEQIPKMAQIYSLASRVIASIVPTDVLTEDNFKLLSGMAQTVKSARDGGISPVELRKSSDERFGGDSWRQRPYDLLMELTTLPWFSRVWVRQEVALAAKWPIILIGKYQMHMDDLCDLWRTVSNEREIFDQPRLRAMDNIRTMIHYTGIVLKEIGQALDTAGLLLHVILSYGVAQATLPHDQIYGLLGQVYALIEKTNNPPLPSQLDPDYTRPFEKVYHEFTVYILEHTRDLRLIETVYRELGGVPSWVPDLRHLGSDMTWNMPKVKANLKFSESRNELQVEGIRTSVLQTSLPCMRNASLCLLDLRDRVNDFEERIIKPSAEITNTPLETVREKWFDNISKNNKREEEELYQKMLAIIAEPPDIELSDYCLTMDDASVRFLVFLDNIYVLFQNGNFGVCNRRDAVVEKGDILCLFKGAHHPWVLRPVAGGYVFVASCTLTDYMYSKDIREEWFFNQSQCEVFNIL
ncbi:HET-domain-containing protein [Daldinia caldariorum]|uniref:HET-domain-containing protein n=1 Tax=Daldinia caldariorum TaxID=326644 RepID=UPI002008C0F3|nr:HET-domain-containing protein [Daldinia caldariorum]KAI1463393.1 HET-domain-containing protein [Daldinia caldariorum]